MSDNYDVHTRIQEWDWLSGGRKLSAIDARSLETELQQSPDDVSSRVKLAQYYYCRLFARRSLLQLPSRFNATKLIVQKKHEEHVCWIIENVPDASIASGPHATFDHYACSASSYELGKSLWLKQVERFPTDTRVIANAARFFYLKDKPMAKQLLESAKNLQPEEPSWPAELALLHRLTSIRQKKQQEECQASLSRSLAAQEEALALASDKERKQILSILPMLAYESGQYDKASHYAAQVIELFQTLPYPQNYLGAHDSNIVLGSIALDSGDIEKAKQYLMLAAETPIVAPLSFGPGIQTLTFVRKLITSGQRNVVLVYLVKSLRFWPHRKFHIVKLILSIFFGFKPSLKV